MMATARSLLVLVFVFALCSLAQTAAASASEEGFRESLRIAPLADGRVHMLFSFELTSAGAEIDEQQPNTASSQQPPLYSTVPRPLVHLAQASDADEVHLAINAGRWDYARWGWPTTEPAVGTGAEVWASLRANATRTTATADNGDGGSARVEPALMARWRTLTANLAGLFCASLDALDERLTVTPWTRSFPSSSSSSPSNHSSKTLHATLSSEAVCTENLSPLLKLLPCKQRAGLASLLEPHHFFAADFHGMALHVVRRGEDGRWAVEINVQAVFSPVMLPGLRGKRDWSLSGLLGRRMEQACPLADESAITVVAPAEVAKRKKEEDEEEGDYNFLISPILVLPQLAQEERDAYEDEAARFKRFERAFIRRVVDEGHAVYDTRTAVGFDVRMYWPTEGEFVFPHSYPNSPAFSADRSFLGAGQERGRIEVTLRNTDAVRARSVVYYDVLPWFIRPLLHSLQASVEVADDDDEEGDIVRFADDLTAPIVEALRYSASTPRGAPLHLEATVRVPPQSTVRLRYDYDKAFLRYAEHPPDAHRGFDIAPAVFLPAGSSKMPRLYTNPSLVEVAVPDFSMPYNVIIFTSTLIALCAGSVLNNLVRKYADVVVEP
ncbi:Gpi16 subunit, GPI transamidase component [Acaromyces ingoldii]|uniref:Gpi16 subunit, GPI transamidase component n=1 Tax=Acaromyces ingoldii TaxID=215250 RepID=A0A316YEB7_9BASI|nr:Gpi16 subunit, GPI transamidase component [Acaromyces ingoldii]PWN87920.1 Gpi16 subunit, GPI transamidase component [Acaromyces ingoldii]